MPDSESVVIDPKQNFTPAVKLRFALWETMISEITMDQEIKRQITDVLKKLRDEGLTAWDSLELAFSSTVEAFEAVSETWKATTSQPSVQALFQNLKKDIAELQHELLNPAAQKSQP